MMFKMHGSEMGHYAFDLRPRPPQLQPHLPACLPAGLPTRLSLACRSFHMQAGLRKVQQRIGEDLCQLVVCFIKYGQPAGDIYVHMCVHAAGVLHDVLGLQPSRAHIRGRIICLVLSALWWL